MKYSGDLKYAKYIIMVLTILLLGISLIIYFFIIRDTSFSFVSHNETIYKDDYTMQINYPVFNENEVNKEIKKIIKNEKNNFLKEIKNTDYTDNELNINYSYTMNSSIYSIHLRTYSYIGEENEYYRNDNVFYINEKNNEQINLDELIIDDGIYDLLKTIASNYLKENKNNITLYDNEKVEKNLNSDIKNYILIFSEDKLYLIIPPHKVSPYDGEISISVDYKYVKKYLNENYFLNLDSIKEIDYLTGSVKRIRDSEYFKDKKLIALTFDDGPSYNKTQRLVEELNKRDARATFFMLGELANKQHELVRFVYSSGHTIGSHTYDHKNLKKLDDEQLNYEINYTNEILKNIIGQDITFLRPPYGAYNQKLLSQIDMSFILWGYDTLDWQLRDVDKITEEIVNGAEDGEIILLHDIHSETVEAAIKAVDILQESGYVFVSLEELITYKKVDIEPNTAYRHFKNIINEK